MGNKFKFIDSNTEKAKKTHFQHTEDDIVLTLPDESGTIVTTNTVDDILDVDENGDSISGYILKPDIGNNAGINEESNSEPIYRAPYVTSNKYVGPLEWTLWEASLVEDFSSIVDTTSDPKDKDVWLPNTFTTSTDVYVRYRFHSGDLRSPFSDTIHYKTPPYGIGPFTITVNDSIKPLIKTSGFTPLVEDVAGPINHVSTTWIIKRADTNETVFSAVKDTVNKLQIQIPNCILEPVTKYVVYVTYYTDNDLVPYSPTRAQAFITPNVYIETPVLRFTGDNSLAGIVINKVTGSKYKIYNSDETHTYTKWTLSYIKEDGTKKIVYQTNDMVNKEVFDVSNIALGPDIEYIVEAVYYSTHYQSDEGAVRFNVKPYRAPKLKMMVINKNSDIFGTDADPEIKNIYNNLTDDYIDGVRFKVIKCSKWNGTRYILENDVFDLAYAGPMVIITSDDFNGSNQTTPKFDFERMIIRAVDTYSSSEPWFAAQEEESTLTTINKADIRSFSIPYGSGRKRYYFFYPLLLDRPYANKKHEMLKNGLDIAVYLEHAKFNTEVIKTATPIIAYAFSWWNEALTYTYNVRALNSNHNNPSSLTFIQNPSKITNPASAPTYVLPYIFRQYINTATVTLSFYNGSTLVASETFTGLNNTNGYAVSYTTLSNLSYNTNYTMVQSLNVPILQTLVCKPINVTFKKATIAEPKAIINVNPETDEDIILDILNVVYKYTAYAPLLNKTMIPMLNGTTVDYNCSPDYVRYIITETSNGNIVYDKTFRNDDSSSIKFTPSSMPANNYSTSGVNTLRISTYKNDYNTPGDLILKYNTDYKLGVQLAAKNGILSPVEYTTFNTGNKPPVTIAKPTITVAPKINTRVVDLSSSAFKVTGLSDKTHKATEWFVYNHDNLTTPIFASYCSSGSNSLTNYTMVLLGTFHHISAVFWGKTYVYGVRHKASNDQWSEIGYSDPVVIKVPDEWNNISVAGLGDLYQNGTKFDYKITSLRHPQMQYAKSFHVQLIITAPEDVWSKYDGTYKANMTYAYSSSSTRYYSYKKDIVIPFKDADPTSYIASIACDLSCWTLIYNADYWIEWYDGSTTIHSDGIRTGKTGTPASYNFTQEEINNVNPNPGFAYSTKQVKVIDRLTAPKTSLTQGISNSALAVKGQITNFELGTRPPGITGTSWYLYRSNNTSTPVVIYENDGTNINSVVFPNGQHPLNSEYIIKAKYVNTKYGYETPIGTSITFNPAAVITYPYYKVTVDWSTNEFVISDFYYPFDQYVKGYALSVFRRTNFNSNGCTDLNGKTATYNNVINTPLFKKATTNYRCFVLFSWNRNEPPSYPISNYRGPEYLNVPDGWTNKYGYSELVNGVCGPNDTANVDIQCEYNRVVNTIDANGVVTTRLFQAIPNETVNPNTTVIEDPKCQFNGLGTWRKSLGKSPNGQRFKLHLDDNLWTLPKVNGKYQYVATNVIIVPVFHDNTTVYHAGCFDVTLFNNRWTDATLKNHAVQTANGYTVQNQIFSNTPVSWAETIVTIRS